MSQPQCSGQPVRSERVFASISSFQPSTPPYLQTHHRRWCGNNVPIINPIEHDTINMFFQLIDDHRGRSSGGATRALAGPHFFKAKGKFTDSAKFLLKALKKTCFRQSGRANFQKFSPVGANHAMVAPPQTLNHGPTTFKVELQPLDQSMSQIYRLLPIIDRLSITRGFQRWLYYLSMGISHGLIGNYQFVIGYY